MRNYERHFNRLVLAGCLGIALVIFVVASIVASNIGRTSLATQTRQVCVSHGGVRQVDSNDRLAICMDGYVGGIH